MGEDISYRCNFKLRRRGDAALAEHQSELKSEDFDTDEDFCMAVASDLIEMLKEDREYLNEMGERDAI